MWQLAPAGSVDADAVAKDGTINLHRQLLRELREELGLGPETVDESRPLCIVEHPGSRIADLGLALATKLSAEVVVAAHRRSGNGEYDRIVVVTGTELAAFLAEEGGALVPPAREFLKRVERAAQGGESSH
jgi:hypothetical protein